MALASEGTCKIGDRPVAIPVAENLLFRQFDGPEPGLTRHGYSYSVRSLDDQFRSSQQKSFSEKTLIEKALSGISVWPPICRANAYMCGRPLGARGEFVLTVGRVHPCVRPVVATSGRWP